MLVFLNKLTMMTTKDTFTKTQTQPTQRKQELIWTGAKNNLLKIFDGAPPLTLGGTHITTSNVVRVLGVPLTPNLSLDKHVTALSAKCFFSCDNYARRRLHRHTGACVCRQPRRLLCRSTGWCLEEDDRQAATRPQRGSASRIEPRQVRPRTDPVPAPHFTLARRRRPDPVQAVRSSVQVSQVSA